MADDSFVDSPWVQLGVPLAAVAASAIAPRHAGRVSALGLNAFHGINQYRYGQQRLSQLNAQNVQDQQEAQDFDKNFKSLMEQDEPTAHQPAPEGGGGPEAVSTSGAQQMDQGGGPPKIHGPRIHPEQKQELGVMYQLVGHDRDGRRAIAKRLSDMLEANTHPTLESIQGVDQSKMNVDTYSGKTNLGDSFTLKRPEAPKPQTIEQELANPDLSGPRRTDNLALLAQEGAAKANAIPETYDIRPNDAGALMKTGHRSGQMSPVTMAGPSPRLSTQLPPAPAAQSAPPPPPAGQRLSSPAPQAAPRAAPAQTQARAGPGPMTFGVKPEEADARAAILKYKADNPTASAGHRAAAAKLITMGVDPTSLDHIAEYFGHMNDKDPDQAPALMKFNDAVGRGGAPVRTYLIDRILEKNPHFDARAIDQKIALINEFADPKAQGGGRMASAYGTILAHTADAQDVIRKYSRDLAPIINKPLNELMTNYAGVPGVLELSAALSPVAEEYAILQKSGYAPTREEMIANHSMMDPSKNVDQLLAVSDRIAHTAIAKAHQQDAIYRQSIGSSAPSFHTPEIEDSLKRLGFTEPAPGKTKFGKTPETDVDGRPIKKNAQGQYVYAN